MWLKRLGIFWWGMVFPAVIFLFAGCVKPPPRPELVIWVTYNDEELALFREICLEWSEASRFPVAVKQIPWGGHEAKIRTALTTHSGPDIARVDCGFVQELGRFNACENLKNWGFDPLFRDLNSAALLGNKVNDAICGIPDQITCLALFYNKSLLKDRGILLPTPLNLEQFVDVLKRVTQPEKGIYGLAMEKPLWFWLPIFYGFGADLTDSTGKKFGLQSPEGVKAITFMRELFGEHKVEAGSWQAGCIQPEVGFLNQRYAFILSGPWNLARFQSTPGLDFGVTLIPTPSGGSATNIGGTNMVLFKGSPHKKEATDFLKFYLSPEVQARWAGRLSQIPVNKRAGERLNLTQKPYLQVFIDQIAHARPRPPIMKFGKLCEYVEPEIEAALKGDKTVEQALNDAAQNVEKKVLELER